jgi:hypothetical protein
MFGYIKNRNTLNLSRQALVTLNNNKKNYGNRQ